jgi:hypothetical protein
MLRRALIAGIAVAALALPAAALGKPDATAPCNGPPDAAAAIAQTRAAGFTIAPGALQALQHVSTNAPGRILVGTKGPKAATAGRSVQSANHVTAGDVASLGCPVGSAAHVWWDSGGGYVQEYWHWATIGGQTGTSSPAPGSCSFTTCHWYAWAAGVSNRYYRSVSVYNTWYAFIDSAGCGY